MSRRKTTCPACGLDHEADPRGAVGRVHRAMLLHCPPELLQEWLGARDALRVQETQKEDA